MLERDIVSPIFFTCTVKAEVYRDIICEFLGQPERNEALYFQQYSARPHNCAQHNQEWSWFHNQKILQLARHLEFKF